MEEIEVKFLDVDPEEIEQKVLSLGGKLISEGTFREAIYSDSEGKWIGEDLPLRKRVRVRQDGSRITISYKAALEGAKQVEITLKAKNFNEAIKFLEAIGLKLWREQEKRRKSFKLGNVLVEIDWWPKAPPWVEIEGDSEEEIKEVAKKLGLDWEKADTRDALQVLEETYKLPVESWRVYTFERCE